MLEKVVPILQAPLENDSCPVQVNNALVDALVAAADPKLLTRDVRPYFEKADVVCRMALNGRFNEKRSEIDGVYVLNIYQHLLVANFYRNLLTVAFDAELNAHKELDELWSHDCKKHHACHDWVFLGFGFDMEGIFVDGLERLLDKSPQTAATAIEVINGCYHVERAIYGSNRVRPRSGFSMLCHSLTLAHLEKQGAYAFEKCITRHPTTVNANLKLNKLSKDNGRWEDWTVTAGEEEYGLEGILCLDRGTHHLFWREERMAEVVEYRLEFPSEEFRPVVEEYKRNKAAEDEKWHTHLSKQFGVPNTTLPLPGMPPFGSYSGHNAAEEVDDVDSTLPPTPADFQREPYNNYSSPFRQ
jgi:hypothetical protein